MDEKRNYKRAPVNAIIMYNLADYVNKDDDEDILSSFATPESVDISTGGLKIITSQKLPLNIRLKIILSIIPTKVPIEVEAKVAWTTETENEGLYQSGIEFTRFENEEQKKFIEDFVRQH